MSKTYVPLDRVEDNPYQSRIDTGDVESLAEKILEHGLRQLPEARLFVDDFQPKSFTEYTSRKNGEWWLLEEKGRAQIATGHRRVHAIRLLNDDDTVTEADLKEADLSPGVVPVDLQRLTDDEMLDLLTIENAAREDLSPVEQARLIREHEEAGRSNAEIASTFGRSSSWVSNRKKLLALPARAKMWVHEGEVSVRQVQALMPIFDSDWREVGFPDENQFHPETIIEDALGGMPSGALRKKVTQFESWLRQLKGKTQEEVRQQEYEQDLESDTQTNGRRQTGKGAKEEDAEHDSSVPSKDSARGGDGAQGRGEDTVRRDVDRSLSGDDEEQRDGSAGAPDAIIRPVAEQIASEIDSSVLTRHLMMLGVARHEDRVDAVAHRLSLHLHDVGPEEAADELREWLSELGYTEIEVPEPQAV